MKAVILAAGQGTRIREIHGQHPKCLIRVDGRTILDHQLESLGVAGIREAGIVVGYEKEQIMRHVHSRYRDRSIQISFIENPAFAITNNMYSLWAARHWVGEHNFVCLNADVIFKPQVLVSALTSTAPISMIVDPEWRDETMKVIISGDRVVQMSKRIPRETFSGTYIGITVFSAEANRQLFDRLDTLVSAGRVNGFFNVAVQQMADEGVHVGFTSTAGLPWAEIDDPADLAFAQEHVFPKLAAAA
jgi:L-glutamine-phosphate cytidylyltransferase